MTYQTEFPDFDASTMPEIPADFVDCSWHNDTCPSFYNEKLSMYIYVDYADKLLREFKESERFGLAVIGNDNDEVIFETSSDDYDYILSNIALYR
jgi:hypothetical protein